MKKIIATVLAMVMALALCTTAFADLPLWTNNGSTANVDLFDGQFNTKTATGKMTFNAAVAPTVTDGKVTKEGTVAHYIFATKNPNTEDYDVYQGTYILVNSIPANADASQYVLVKAADENVKVGDKAANQSAASQTLIMKKVTAVNYYYTATEFTAWGDLCGQYKKPSNTDTVTYFSYTDNDGAKIAAAKAVAENAVPSFNVLFNGEVLTIDTATYQTAKQHSWAASAWDKKGVATEYTCATCKTVAKVINSPVNAPAGSTIERIGNTLIAFTYTPGTANNTTNTGSNKSPKTFDAGIAMYVGMALTSVAGSAVVIGKKKEF